MNNTTPVHAGQVRFLALLRTSLLSLLKVFSFGRGAAKRGAKAAVGALLLICALGVYLMGVYSALLASMLDGAGALRLLPALVSLLACLLAFVFTVPAAGGIVFGGRDNDLLLALPVSAFEILLSKVLALYLENLVLTLSMVLTGGVVYLLYGGPGGGWVLPAALFGGVLLALLPTLLALLFGYLAAWMGARLGKQSILGTLFYLAFFVVVLLGAFQVQNGLAALMRNVDKLAAAMRGPLLPFGLMGRAFAGGMGAMGALGLLALLLGLPFLLAVWLFSRGYKGIVTRMAARHGRSDYRLGALRAGSPAGALLKKDALKFFFTPIYLLNCGFGLVVLLIAAAAALIKRDWLLGLLAQMGYGAGSPMVYALVCGGVLLMLSSANTASVSLSLEGKYLWILQSAPLPAARILYGKAGFNVLLGLPVLLAAAGALTFAFGFTPGQLLLLVLAGTALLVFLSLLGVWINLCFPKLDAANETIVVKQSLAAMLGMLGGMALVGTGALLYWLLHSVLPFPVFLLGAAAVLCIGAALLTRTLATAGIAKFRAL